jgi:hypothetical protein
LLPAHLFTDVSHYIGGAVGPVPENIRVDYATSGFFADFILRADACSLSIGGVLFDSRLKTPTRFFKDRRYSWAWNGGLR